MPGTKRQRILLPYTGVVNDNCCMGIRPNYGLYTQCTKQTIEGKEFCKRCLDTVDDIRERGKKNWRSKNGKKPTPYVKVMHRLRLTIEDVEMEVRRQGIEFDLSTIKDLHQNTVSRSRIIASDSSPERDDSPEPTHTKRGRPRNLRKSLHRVPSSPTLLSDLLKN